MLSLLIPLTTQAAPGQWYLGGGPAYSFLDPDTSPDPNLSVADDTDIGGKIFGGYDFTKHWSLEAFFGVPGQAGLAPQGTVDYDGLYGLGGVFSWPHNGPGLSGFVKGGGAALDTDAGNLQRYHENAAQIFAGGGVRYNFGKGWGVRVEYEYFFADVQMITLSVVKRFGVFGRDEELAEPEPQEPRVEVVETTIGDEDEDGVPDNVDRCPGTPAGTVVDDVGCEVPPPPPPPPVETLEEVSLDARGLFRVNSARVTPQGRENLREFVDNLGHYEQVNAIAVEGHTDSSGSAAYNLKLARQRAEAVKSVLLETGVDPAIMTVESYGELRPIADNATAEGRAKNRRVDLKVRAVKKTQ